MLNVVIFGPPGSGKGTQSVKIADKFNLEHISTGDIFREELSRETPLGIEAKKFINQGLLVPDEVVIGMLSSRLDKSLARGAEGFIFDGFPRTIAQAEAFDKLLDLKEMDINCVLALDVQQEELVKRIHHRGKTSGRADDTNEDTIRKRIKVYFDETAPVAKYYEEQDKLVKIKGEGTIEEIFTKLSEAINQHC